MLVLFQIFSFSSLGQDFGIIVTYEFMSKGTIHMKYQTNFNLGLFLLENKV